MALSALRSPTVSSQFSLHKYGKLYNRPTLSHWNSIHKCRRQFQSKCRALRWETDSSITHESQPKEFDGDLDSLVTMTEAEEEDTSIDERESISKQNENETLMLSVAPLSYLVLAALPADTIRSVFGPFAELVKTWNLPDWLVHWGHPGNMAVVLFAMGGYGSYLGWQIRLSDDVEVKAKAKDLHPKLLAGMFFFFALGATGGITSLLTSDKSILESPHAITGLIGLSLLTIQTILPALFEGNPNLRNVHGFLGSGIMTLFLIHSVLGLQLGLSF
ncbi:uncharacterized protein LOC131077797 isoform X2 [Cryptomeria japonica]|uniref:uncharacterized protein LOC131077797 isoform X2 n=1 Tax=Cryptomeria japonica TaxID=3369 RepID=UPI0025ACBCB5|nr:uncharacterized protein LOC131077797 isoform X2 [Cryptomeria japonica]